MDFVLLWPNCIFGSFAAGGKPGFVLTGGGGALFDAPSSEFSTQHCFLIRPGLLFIQRSNLSAKSICRKVFEFGELFPRIRESSGRYGCPRSHRCFAYNVRCWAPRPRAPPSLLNGADSQTPARPPCCRSARAGRRSSGRGACAPSPCAPRRARSRRGTPAQ